MVVPIADLLVGWLESFQGWVGGLLEDAEDTYDEIINSGIQRIRYTITK